MLDTMFEVQRGLSRFQAVPILGPVVGSPIKALVSTAQIVAGFAATIFYSALFSITQSTTMFEWTATSFGHLTMGAVGLAYSIMNMCTLGMGGLFFETNIAIATQSVSNHRTTWLY